MSTSLRLSEKWLNRGLWAIALVFAGVLIGLGNVIAIDFCPHCGIGLFESCGTCSARKNAFSPFCEARGAAANAATTKG